MKNSLAFWGLFFCLKTFAQTDSASLLLSPAVLPDSLVVRFKPAPAEDVFTSATRYPERRDQLPFTTYVVTAEEIQRNGYVTLADVLRFAPGIRVSQPGNAFEGETFQMRGLAGNQYVKILINNVPVKPGAALGMPIGAQLPIRQAERIEILYGPAGAVYGSDACAGVVNIILKESERPLFTQAGLSFGALGYNDLNLMFGGKLGKDKKIFRFSIYGSSTVRERTDVFYNSELLNTYSYLPVGVDSSAYTNHRNYVSEADDKDQPKTAPFAHESRLFGVHMDWRGIQFGYQRMARFDHSALGLNPLAISYANPSTRVGEQIQTFSMGFNARIGKLRTQNILSVQSYKLDNTSSALYIFEQLSAARFRYLNPPPLAQDAVLRGTRQTLTDRERYTLAHSVDARFDTRFRLVLGERLSLDMGGFFQLSRGYAGTRYLELPFETSFFEVWQQPKEIRDSAALPRPFEPYYDQMFEVNFFPNLKWESRRLTVMAGTALNFNDFSGVFAPRLAGHFRFDSAWAVRATLSSGFRQPPMWGLANSYVFSQQEIQQRQALLFLGQTEEIRSVELGIRYSKPKTQVDVSAFFQRAYNLARNGYYIAGSDRLSPSEAYYGWANAPGLAQSLWGVQLSAKSQTIDWTFDLEGRQPFVLKWKNELNLQYARGREQYGYGVASTDDVRNLPRWMWQFRTSWEGRKNTLIISTVRQFSWLSGGAFYEGSTGRTVQSTIPGYATWDLMFRRRMSEHFRIYLQVLNVFNRRHGGLDATGTPDDLRWNPQQGRQTRFGIVYSMQ